MLLFVSHVQAVCCAVLCCAVLCCIVLHRKQDESSHTHLEERGYLQRQYRWYWAVRSVTVSRYIAAMELRYHVPVLHRFAVHSFQNLFKQDYVTISITLDSSFSHMPHPTTLC